MEKIDFLISSFDAVQKQESIVSFYEISPSSSLLFRKGRIGSWREELSKNRAQQIVHDHQEVMRRFGYLDDKGEIVY